MTEQRRKRMAFLTVRRLSFVMFAFLSLLLVQPGYAGLDEGPWLQNITANSVDLLYEGDDPDDNGLVEYGISPSYGSSVPATKRFAFDEYYAAELTGLTQNTLYYYRLTHEGTSREGTFYTAPPAGESFTFAVVGDTRSGHAAHQQVVDAIIANDGYPDLYLNSGDLIASGEIEADWDTFFGIEQEMLANTVFLPSFGNHESGEIFLPSLYGKYFDSGANNSFWYAFPYGNAFFLVLNTERPLGGIQGEYIDEQLQAARDNPDIDFIFVLFHAPGVSTSTSHKPNLSVLTSLLDKLENYNVDAVFNGHNHLYEHGIVNGVHHIVTGGGGAGLYGYIDPYTPDGWDIVYRESVHHYCWLDVTSVSYTMECKYVNGTVFDSYTATTADGGYPGPTPQDLLDRALDIGCGSFITRALGIRVEDVDASMGPVQDQGSNSLAALVAVNGLLYGIPGLFIFGLRRRMNRT